MTATITIKTSTGEKQFKNKNLINIGSNPKCDYFIQPGFDIILTVQVNKETGVCYVFNNFKNPKLLFRGQVLGRIQVDKVCKLTLENSDEFIEIHVDNSGSIDMSSVDIVNLSDTQLRDLYGDDPNVLAKIKLEKSRAPLEKARIAIIKQIAYPIAELKSKILANARTSLFLHLALYITSILSSFAVANYLMGLSTQEASQHVYLAVNIQAWLAYSFVVFAIALMLKQGVYLYFQSKTIKLSPSAAMAKNFLLWGASIFIIGIYTVNQIYFMSMSNFVAFSIFITFFFVGIMTALAIGCGYFKSNTAEYNAVLNKYEFREDFESVLKSYRVWIDRFVNSMSDTKIRNVKDKLFMLQLKSFGEVIIGLLTAPFLAYGVSNTLAMCFPEAAGWVRISGFRFSPVFLVLATFLIIFAFFAFVSSFLAGKKIQGSSVIKQDGFTDYRQHGVSIFGLEGARKLEHDKKLFLTIACVIVFIEFMMNVSYFMSETGGDFKGIMLSIIAALVPTALLIAETLMLGQTRFEVYACDELITKLDKD